MSGQYIALTAYLIKMVSRAKRNGLGSVYHFGWDIDISENYICNVYFLGVKVKIKRNES